METKRLKNVITFSPKYGYNTTTQVCFWCSKELAIIQLGKINDEDIKAPEFMVIDYNPCTECDEAFKKGILFISATNENNGMPQIVPGIYPDGAWCVVTDEGIEESDAFTEEEKGKLLKDRISLVTPEEYYKLFGE